MLVAGYRTSWEYLSADHAAKDKWISEIIENYSAGRFDRSSYSIIGTFGAGKTQLLYHIFELALARKLLPMYFLAEDLFREIISTANIVTPGDLFSAVESKVDRVKAAIVSADEAEWVRLVDPRGRVRKESPEMLDALRSFEGSDPKSLKIVLLVDELEGQYGIIQSRVQTRDRSPLREWLEARNYLKFLAFAPAGIYELGGADRDRIMRIVLPSADIDYVRTKLENDAGRSNSCWWLSRGKARQLFKTHEILKRKQPNADAADVSRFLRHELDSIGQPPTEVPAAVIDKVLPTKVPYLVNIRPVKGTKAMRYVIDAAHLDTGKLAEKLIEAFHINKENAILIAEYFKKTVKSLSNEEWLTYIGSEELADLFSLVFDHLLEYEHGSPQISNTLGDVLNLYERVRKDSPALHGTVARLWELKEVEWQNPLSVSEIRSAFPFPSMNPIVKNFQPEEVREKWLAKGLPIWRWTNGNVIKAFFASEKDFLQYSEKDVFTSEVLPEGRELLCLFPPGQGLTQDKPLVKWLKENRKLSVVELPALLADFLLSAAGTIEGQIPGELSHCIEAFRMDRGDVLLSRKTEIYAEAIEEIARGGIQSPAPFFRSPPPDADTVWGKGQMADRDAVTVSIGLAYADVTSSQKDNLCAVRDLFRSSKEGRGAGDLNKLMPRGGFISIADDLLPRLGRKKELRDSEPIARLMGYWRDEERRNLLDLSRILSLTQFLQLNADEDTSRMLESLWRTARMSFEVLDVAGLGKKFDSDICPVLEDCTKVEAALKKDLGVAGIDFQEMETLVRSKQGILEFSGILGQAISDGGTSAPLVQQITGIFAKALLERIDKEVRVLASTLSAVKRAHQELRAASSNLSRNFFEYRKAVQFSGITQKIVEVVIKEQMNLSVQPKWTELEMTLLDRKEYLVGISSDLGKLEKKLGELETLVGQVGT